MYPRLLHIGVKLHYNFESSLFKISLLLYQKMVILRWLCHDLPIFLFGHLGRFFALL